MIARRLLLVVALLLIQSIPTLSQMQEILTYHLSNPSVIPNDTETEIYLSQPRDFCLGNADTLYVLDTGDNNIKVFRLSGEHLFTFSRYGHGPGEFARPRVMKFFNNSLYVADSDPMRIVEFNSAGQFQRNISLIQNPMDLAISQTHAYVSVFSSTTLVLEVPLDDPDSQRSILTYEQAESFILERIGSPFRSPARCFLALSGGYLVVANSDISLLAIIDIKSESREFTIIDPQSTLIDEHWEHSADVFHSNIPKPIRGKVPVSMYNSVTEWGENEVLLEIRTGSRETFRSVASVFSILDGSEIGPRITATDGKYADLRLLRENIIGWIHVQDATIEIFQIEKD